MSTCLIPEVIISSSSAKQSCNWSIKDVDKGNVLAVAKSGLSSSKTLCLAGKDYLVSAVPESPIINVWHLAHTKQTKKMVVPGVVTALAVSRQGHYLVAGIENKLHLWQVATGNLLRILHGHHQRVNCIKFTNDGSYFISGGDDAQTLVWTVSSVLNFDSNSNEPKTNDVITPSFIWKHHSMGVNDIHVGYFGCKARVLTVSSDHTCKLYQLSSGCVLMSFFMDISLLSVSMDPAEQFVFLGDENGDIHCITLAHCNSSNEVHYDESNEKVFKKFSGHSATVMCLSVSMDGQTLLSGSKDRSLKLWDIFSGTLRKTLNSEGPITNAFLVMTPPVIKNTGNKKYAVPAFQFETLKRHLHTDEKNADEDGTFKNGVPLNLRDHQLKTWDLASGMDISEVMKSSGASENSKSQLNEEISSVKKTNEQMYYYLVDTVMSTLKK